MTSLGSVTGEGLARCTGWVEQRDLFVVAYDVRDPKRLRRALEVLKGWSTGGQKSVFECFLTPAECGQVAAEMRQVLEGEDRYLMVRLDPRPQVLTLGIAVAPEDPPFFYVG
jgi:CRISPR-associated protein Cas2